MVCKSHIENCFRTENHLILDLAIFLYALLIELDYSSGQILMFFNHHNYDIHALTLTIYPNNNIYSLLILQYFNNLLFPMPLLWTQEKKISISCTCVFFILSHNVLLATPLHSPPCDYFNISLKHCFHAILFTASFSSNKSIPFIDNGSFIYTL